MDQRAPLLSLLNFTMPASMTCHKILVADKTGRNNVKLEQLKILPSALN
jgi:hypothetical protein